MSNQDTVKYNDQHTFGMGYLNRARTVTPNQGKQYEAVSLTGLGGRVDSPTYTYYDCSSVIAKALPKYILLKDAINDPNQKVMVRFKVSDGIPDSYLTKDKRTGQDVRRHVIKGRLLDIAWASINGQVVQFELEDECQQADNQPNQTGDSHPASVDKSSESLFEDELGEFININQDDPQFMGKINELKHLGYMWDSSKTAWYKPLAA